MTKVFIGGSRRVSRLNADVRERLDGIIEKGLPVVIGDANGVDKAVQQYLQSRGYERVEVFSVEGGCRNNVGKWPLRSIPAKNGKKDLALPRNLWVVCIGEAVGEEVEGEKKVAPWPWDDSGGLWTLPSPWKTQLVPFRTFPILASLPTTMAFSTGSCKSLRDSHSAHRPNLLYRSEEFSLLQ